MKLMSTLADATQAGALGGGWSTHGWVTSSMFAVWGKWHLSENVYYSWCFYAFYHFFTQHTIYPHLISICKYRFIKSSRHLLNAGIWFLEFYMALAWIHRFIAHLSKETVAVSTRGYSAAAIHHPVAYESMPKFSCSLKRNILIWAETSLKC